jgi:hypothetical protein
VTLDNAFANAIAMRNLKPVMSKYLGLDVVDDFGDFNDSETNVVDSIFLHQRCACHIINLIVKEALTTLKLLIETFRLQYLS